MFETLLLERFLRHDKILAAEDLLFLGGWEIIAVLRVSICGLFIRALLPAFLFLLFGFYLNRVFIVQSVIFSGASSVFSWAMWLGAAPWAPVFGLCTRRFILDWILLSSGVSIIHTSY